MAASVLFACGLNETKLPGFVHISEESSMDGSFLISSILGQRLRISNAGTMLICLQRKYGHYFNVGMRLGYNANLFLGKTLHVIDPLSDIEREFFDSKWLGEGSDVTSLLMTDIEEKINSNYANRSSITILIDNLSVLLNLGAEKEKLQKFCRDLAALPEKYVDKNLTIITKMSNSDVFPVEDRGLAQLSDLHISLIKLQSGAFSEVDGKLIVERFKIDGGYLIEKTNKEVLYKVNDRNIKIYNPGEVGVKI